MKLNRLMSKARDYTVNEFLNNDEFIVWVNSKNKTNNDYWLEMKRNLSKNELSELLKAERIIEKIKYLNEDEVNLSTDFIQDQYIRLLESSATIRNKRPIKSKVIYLKSLMKYAAAIVIFFSLSIVIYNNVVDDNSFSDHLVASRFNTEDILLQVSDNEYYKITTETNNRWLTSNGEFISVNSNRISFVASDNIIGGEDEYKLYIPSGKKFNITLIDGSRVELNSNSVLAFNNSTVSEKRKVSIKGEAFFDVAHNLERPFVVKSLNATVEVLGTEFNISNYNSDGFVRATLLKGSIKIFNSIGESKIIEPGNQATIYNNKSEINIKPADIQKAVAWISGKMIFVNERIEDLIPKMNRWFGVEFMIEDESLNDYRFTGTLKRENSLTHFLQMLKYTKGVSSKIEDGHVKLFADK